jgi:hypothetical protein
LINELDASFAIGAILKSGMNVIVGEQKAGIDKYMPKFLTSFIRKPE